MNRVKAVLYLLLVILLLGVTLVAILLGSGITGQIKPAIVACLVCLAVFFLLRKLIAAAEIKQKEKEPERMEREKEREAERYKRSCKRQCEKYRPVLEGMGLDAEAAYDLYLACERKYGSTVPTKRQVRIVAEADKKLHFTFQDDMYWTMYQAVKNARREKMFETLRPIIKDMGLDPEITEHLSTACLDTYGATGLSQEQVRKVAEADREFHCTLDDDQYWTMYQAVTEAIVKVMDRGKNRPLPWD